MHCLQKCVCTSSAAVTDVGKSQQWRLPPREGMEPRASYVLGKRSAAEPHPKPHEHFFHPGAEVQRLDGFDQMTTELTRTLAVFLRSYLSCVTLQALDFPLNWFPQNESSELEHLPSV